MNRIVKIALGSGVFLCGALLFALPQTGCSPSSAPQEAPKIDGLPVGDHRDKMELEAQKGSARRAKSSAKKQN